MCNKRAASALLPRVSRSTRARTPRSSSAVLCCTISFREQSGCAGIWTVDGASNLQIPRHPDCSLKEIVQHNTALVERGVLARVLRETRGNKAEAARLLHIDYKTIQLKIKGYGLQIDRATRGGF